MPAPFPFSRAKVGVASQLGTKSPPFWMVLWVLQHSTDSFSSELFLLLTLHEGL